MRQQVSQPRGNISEEATREKSMRRGIEALLALASEEALVAGGLGVKQVSDRLGREKSQISRTLQILAEYGLVDRDPETLTYRLGWRIWSLAQLAGEQRLLDVAGPILVDLAESIGERAHLSVLQRPLVLTILSERPARAIQTVGWVGRVVPAYCTSSGRALLFDHTSDELRKFFLGVPFEHHGPNTVPNVDALFARIEADRHQGYATVDEEFEPGLVAVGAPVRDARRRITAALNISAPKFRFADRIHEAGRELLGSVANLEQRVGVSLSAVGRETQSVTPG
jgi:IclR family transcriptional regulator, KDG regulon repressor